ncbi:putative oxidoreductase GLYR1 homolog [Trichonephila clavipes]|nr:putative oxidoreductase GLYR1 homolog [Trichonephila clavipes]
MVRGIATAILAEGMSLAESMSFSKNSFQECVELATMNCSLFRELGLPMVTNNFTTNRSLKYQQSDLQMILETSETFIQPLPLVSAANEVYKKAKRFQYSNHDVSAVYFGAKR